MKTAIYTRVSSQHQTEGYSLEAQYDSLVRHVELNRWELVEVYSDPGVSAKDLNRPGIQKLISDIKSGRLEAVVVHKLDRLTRNISNLYELVEMVNKYNVKLLSLSENIDTSTPMGRFFVFMLGIFAQMYRENLAEEVLKGQTKRAEEGKRVSGARPYGYNLGEDLVMTINEEEAEVIRRIFTLFNQGMGKQAIADLLNAEGVPNVNGLKWRFNTVDRIVTNITYAGTAHWNRKDDPEEKRIYVPNAHPAIIPMDMFQAAMEIAATRSTAEIRATKYQYPFSSVVKCGECGNSYRGRLKEKDGSRKEYVCTGRDNSEIRCKASAIGEKRLQALFLEFMRNFVFQSEQPNKVISGKDLTKERKRLEKLIADSSIKRKNYARAMGEGKMPYEVFSELMDEENEKVKTWQEELDSINMQSPEQKKTRRDTQDMVNNLSANWEHWSVEDRKFHIQRLFRLLVIKKVDKAWRIVAYKVNE